MVFGNRMRRTIVRHKKKEITADWRKLRNKRASEFGVVTKY
jgi:hypothetical protein